MAISDLFDAARDLLAGTVTALQANGRTVPGHQFVGVGPPALDGCCETVASSWAEYYEDGITSGNDRRSGNELSRAQACFSVPMARVFVQVWSCYPTVSLDGDTVILPNDTEITQAADRVYTDGWLVFNALRGMQRQGMIFCAAPPMRPGIGAVEWGRLSFLQPNGGCSGFQIDVRVPLQGVACEPGGVTLPASLC